MTNLAWHNDMLACYPVLLERLQEIKQIKKVFEVKELNQLTAERPSVAMLDGCVYVVLDSITPKNENNNKREQVLEIGFSIILVKSFINISPSEVRKGDYNLGQTLTAICKALQGFEPVKNGEFLTLSPFTQKSALNIRYDKGFGLFALRFATDVAIIN